MIAIHIIRLTIRLMTPHRIQVSTILHIVMIPHRVTTRHQVMIHLRVMTLHQIQQVQTGNYGNI
jgi:hypothetical protein